MSEENKAVSAVPAPNTRKRSSTIKVEVKPGCGVFYGGAKYTAGSVVEVPKDVAKKWVNVNRVGLADDEDD